MIDHIYRWFIKDYEETKQPAVRERYGWLAGLVGIISNLLLFILKILVGTIFNSISITADAINNLSDAGSSIITLVGFKVASKPADEKHPYGHARAEYITGFIVSLIIVLLGMEFIKSSYQKIINPDPINFSYLTVVVLIISILIKLWQSLFNRTTGRKIDSTALEATAIDSRNDAITTTSVLVATIFSKITAIQIDGYMGIFVALFIIYSGYKLIVDTLDPLLGPAPADDLIKDLSKRILSYEGVLDFHDLVVHSYGPGRSYASVHVEVPADNDLLDSHDLIDVMEREISKDTDVHLVIHMDPTIIDDQEINELRQTVKKIINKIDPKLTMHDFRMVKGKTHTNLIFDVVIPVGYKTPDAELREKVSKEVFEIDPTFHSVITLDRNYTSTTNI